jgi:hypothetical protein
MSKHTPGPWIFEPAPHGAFDICKDPNSMGRYMVIATRGPHDVRAAEMHANARLIAAAPDLLQALLNLVGTMCAADGSDMEADLDAIDAKVAAAIAAIAKATGEQA